MQKELQHFSSTFWIRKQSLLQGVLCQRNWGVLLCLSGQGCDPLTYETHLQALQNCTKFNTEQRNISVLLHTLFPTHLLPDRCIRVFIEMKSRLRVTIWVRFKESYSSMIVFFLAVNDQLAKNGLLFVPADPEMMSRFSGSKGKLICPQNTESLFCLFESGTQNENWL